MIAGISFLALRQRLLFSEHHVAKKVVFTFPESYALFAVCPLPCLQEWARNQLATAAYKASRAADAGGAAGGAAAAAPEWGCPKCRCARTVDLLGMLRFCVVYSVDSSMSNVCLWPEAVCDGA
jgi:hypothetical protein